MGKLSQGKGRKAFDTGPWLTSDGGLNPIWPNLNFQAVLSTPKTPEIKGWPKISMKIKSLPKWIQQKKLSYLCLSSTTLRQQHSSLCGHMSSLPLFITYWWAHIMFSIVYNLPLGTHCVHHCLKLINGHTTRLSLLITYQWAHIMSTIVYNLLVGTHCVYHCL